MASTKVVQGGYEHVHELRQLESLLTEVEESMRDLSLRFRGEFPARRPDDLLLRIDRARRLVGGSWREVAAGLEWRGLGRYRPQSKAWTRRIGTHLTSSEIERADRRGVGDRYIWYDAEARRLRQRRKKIVTALDRIRKILRGFLGQEDSSAGDLLVETPMLGQGPGAEQNTSDATTYTQGDWD